MIGQRAPKLTARHERDAYAACTARDQGRCVRCGHFGDMERDHRQNRTAWNTVVSNLQLLGSDRACGCHRWKTEHPADAARDGFAVSRWADPAETPAYRYGVGWVLYLNEPDDNGNWWKKVDHA